MARWRRKGTERQLREMQESREGGPLRERTQVSGAGWGQDEKLQEEKEGRRRENLEAEARQAGPGEGAGEGQRTEEEGCSAPRGTHAAESAHSWTPRTAAAPRRPLGLLSAQ